VDDKINGNHSSNRFQDVEQASLLAPLRKPVSRRTVLKTGTGLLVVAAGAGTFFVRLRSSTLAKQQTDNVVLQWNNAALQAIRNTNPGPTIGSRALAIMHTSMYGTWSAYDPVALPTRPNGIPRQKNKWKDITQAVCYAAYSALMDLFPSDASVFTSLMNDLGYDPSNTSADTTTPAGVGNVAAQAVIAYRHGDGSNQLNGYADHPDQPSVLAAPHREWESAKIFDPTLGYRCSLCAGIRIAVPTSRSHQAQRPRTERPWLCGPGINDRAVQR
jgi:hypothetical protein